MNSSVASTDALLAAMPAPSMAADDGSPDVVVIGGGPAGSTCAALLASKGHRVVLLEKGQHPRFHIGESLLPLNMPLFDRLGVRAKVEEIGMLKLGAEFVSPWHEHRTVFNFAEAWDKSFPYAVQVRRSVFDELLFRHAGERGAKTLEGVRVTKVDFDAGERPVVSARNEAGEDLQWRPQFVVDATGRDTLLANQMNLKQRSKKNNSAALYGHFEGAQRNPGSAEGNITIFWFDYGWFWFIPLSDGTTSVGAVCSPLYLKTRKTDPTEFLMQTIALCPALQARLGNARILEPATATGNYSYESSRCRGDRYVMLGDAYAFIDPVFSSGVFLAMNSAFEGAAAVDQFLKGDQKRAARAFKRFEHTMTVGPKMFSWFIYRIQSPAMRQMFMYPDNIFRVQEALLSVLAGDIFRGTPIKRSLIAFKAIYYVFCLKNLRPALAAWTRRKKMLKQSLMESGPA